MRNNKKGQAALEFLTTYGWAFLVILVMIGALGYFGVLSPGNFLPQRCSVGPEFTCDDYQAINNGTDITVSTIMQNNIGESMTAGTFNGTSGDTNLTCTTTSGTVAAGGDLRIDCSSSSVTAFPPVGDKIKVLVVGSYDVTGKTFSKPITAEIYATLQQG